MVFGTSTLALVAFLSGGAALPLPQSVGSAILPSAPELIVRAAFDDLDEATKRRLTYYATNILSNISEMALLERAGDSAAVARTLAQTPQYATRMERTSAESGLTRGEMLTFFLGMLSSELRGPLPNAILNAEGQFLVTSLFGEEDAAADATASAESSGQSGYVDQLRNVDIGGVGVTN